MGKSGRPCFLPQLDNHWGSHRDQGGQEDAGVVPEARSTSGNVLLRVSCWQSENGVREEPWPSNDEHACHSQNMPVPGRHSTAAKPARVGHWVLHLRPFFPSVTPLYPSIPRKAKFMAILCHRYLPFLPIATLFMFLPTHQPFRKASPGPMFISLLAPPPSNSRMCWVEWWPSYSPKRHMHVLGPANETFFEKGTSQMQLRRPCEDKSRD